MPILFDNLKDFSSPNSPATYWSWQNLALTNTRQAMQWDTIKKTPADYLRTQAYSGHADYSVIGKDYAHVSVMGAIEWCLSVQNISQLYISIDMHFIYPQSTSHKVIEVWQDDILLWRRGFDVNLPVSDCLTLDTNITDGKIRLLVLNETNNIGHSKFVYRLKLCTEFDNLFVQKSPLILPQKHQMIAGLNKLPPNLQRKLYEKKCATEYLTPEEKIALKNAVTAKAFRQLNLADRKFGESGFYKIK